MIKDNVSEFLGAFNDLQEALARRLNYKGNKDFATFLYWAKEIDDKVIMTYYDELNAIREFRNILTHESTSKIYPIANPNEKLIQRVKELIDKIGNHKTVGDLFLKEVKTLNIKDSLEEVLEKVNTFGYSQYPVFSNNKLVGIVSENGIVNYLANNVRKGLVDLKKVDVEDILREDKGKNLYTIVQEDFSIFDVEEIFEQEIKKGNSAYVVLISREKEPKRITEILGIITPWDIAQIIDHI